MGNIMSSQAKQNCAYGAAAVVAGAILYFFSAPLIISTAYVMIVGGLIASGTYRYVKSNGKKFGHQQMLETHSDIQLSRQELVATQVSETIPKLPQWKKIPLSNQDLQQIQELTILSYDQKVQLYRCPLSKQIMRQPVTTKCCNKQYEKVMFQYEIQRVGICPNPDCKKQCKKNEIQPNIIFEDAIHAFRLNVRKTYRGLPDCEQKKQWKTMIEEDFGKSYVDNYL